MALTLQLKRRKPRVEIVPMIDVMFFMLVFFLLFSTLKECPDRGRSESTQGNASGGGQTEHRDYYH